MIRVRPSRVAAAGCALIALIHAQPGSAQESLRVRLSWVRGAGAESCIDQSALEARVRARLGRDAFAADAPLLLEGSVSKKERSWHAELRVFDRANALVGQRDLDAVADDCTPIGEAIVLAVALTIDPDAAMRPPGDARVTEGVGAPETAPQQAPMTAPPESALPVLSPPGAPPQIEPYLPAPVPAPAGSTKATTMAHFGARLLFDAGLLPKPSFGASVVGAYGVPHFEGTLGLTYFPEAETADRRFAFGLTAATLGACATTSVSRVVSLSGCGDLYLGAMHGVVLDTTQLVSLNPGDQFLAALALGPGLSATWGPVRLEIGGSAHVPISTKKFTFRGGSPTIFESTAGGIGYAGIGVAMP